MLSGDFERVLKKLNPRLKVWANPNTDKLANVFIVDPVEGYRDIVGIDKNFIPEYSIYDTKGFIVKGGWSRVVWLLYRTNLTTRDRIKRVFPSFFERRIINTVPQIEIDEVQKKIKDLGLDQMTPKFDPNRKAPDSVRMINAHGSRELVGRQ